MVNKVSIVVPVYNVKNDLRCCVNSIINQTYNEWELWLIDDGSTDGSTEICDELVQEDKRIHVIHKENEGVSAARNSGIERATGKYIYFIDSDDCIEKYAIERLIEVAENIEADVVLCGFYYRFVKENSTVENSPSVYFEGSTKELCGECFEEIMKKDLINPPWNKLIRTDVIKQNKLQFNEEISILEDISFSIQVLEKSKKVVVLPEALYHYFFKQQENLVHKFHKNFFEALLFFDECFESYLITVGQDEADIRYHFFFQKTLAYLRKIYDESGYDSKQKYNEMCRICSHEKMQRIVAKFQAQDFPKRVVCYAIRKKAFRILHILYRLT